MAPSNDKHPDDERLSALLDGEANTDFAAHVDGCAECAQRLEALRGASMALQAPVVVAGHLREAAVARAIQTASEPVAESGGSKLLRMSTSRGRTAAPPRRRSSWSAAAALLVAVAMGGWAISQISSDGGSQRPDSDTFAATPTAGGANSDDLSKAAAADSAAGSGQTELATTAAGAFAAGDIGRFASVDEVVAKAQADLGSSDADTHQSFEAPFCEITDGTPLLWQGTLTFQNTPAVAMVHGTSTQWVLEIRSPAASGCGLLATQTFAPSSPR